jgi:hypothetical protein
MLVLRCGLVLVFTGHVPLQPHTGQLFLGCRWPSSRLVLFCTAISTALQQIGCASREVWSAAVLSWCLGAAVVGEKVDALGRLQNLQIE